MRRLDELARFSSDAGALTRLYLTPQHKAAALQVLAWMREAGMAASIDAVGNTVGRYEAAGGPGAPALLLGSHIDTVRNAGRYDGNLGVVVAIEAVAALHARGERLPFAVEVIAFGDEEGVRFPITLTGSHAVAGTFDPAALAAEDEDRVLLGHALRAFGCDPAAIPRVRRRREDVLGYVEVHIEQGPVLEAEDLPVGVVTAIKGASRFIVEIAGTAGHAGTVPMGSTARRARRRGRDGAAGGAGGGRRSRSWSPRSARSTRPPARSTSSPPTRASPSTSAARTTRRGTAPSRACARGWRPRRGAAGVGLRIEKTYDEAAAVCAPAMVEQLEAAIARAAGIRPRRLPSGAGHDGLAMVALCPIGMLFVRCAGGISHNPAESITTEDADTAARVLLDFLRNFRPAAALRTTRPMPNDTAPPAASHEARIRVFLDGERAAQAAFLAELVKVPSDNPPGDCGPHAERVAELLEGLGYEVERHPVPDELVRANGMVSATNLVVRRRFGEGGGGPVVALNAHGDVVPPGEGWTRDPYGAEVVDGWMYGRGVAVSKSDFADLHLGAPRAGSLGRSARRHGRTPPHL